MRATRHAKSIIQEQLEIVCGGRRFRTYTGVADVDRREIPQRKVGWNEQSIIENSGNDIRLVDSTDNDLKQGLYYGLRAI